ncbi:CopG family ribbon-helix-helix protein [Pelagibacterium xiamenense]|uniref:CopG family ribbon-helix-helix protein n=1 Tax=Pelagibacterium xiamenense TaxID=2901140 RepID=UPI001E41B9CB|nr:CopG family ribbon-helix-helix protein [Pelagibacterium xiamenense]MCD7059494.1 CopG family ribbon-helix-helix protein [Pelagibacterium xiamenense]
MPETTTLTVRLSPETKAKLDRIAELTQRSKSFLAAKALDAYATRELEICEKIQEGIEDVKAGRVVPHEQVVEEMNALIDEAYARHSKKRA